MNLNKLFFLLIGIILSGCAANQGIRMMTMEEKSIILDEVCDSIGVESFHSRTSFPYHFHQYKKDIEGINTLKHDIDSFFRQNPDKIHTRASRETQFKSTYDFVVKTNGDGIHSMASPYLLRDNLLLFFSIQIDCQNGLHISHDPAKLSMINGGIKTLLKENVEIKDLNVERIKTAPTIFKISFSVDYGMKKYTVNALYTPKAYMIEENTKEMTYTVESERLQN